MRSGFTSVLRRALQRHPRTAHPILEVRRVIASDVINTQDEWNDADSTAGLEFPPEGGVKLGGSALDHFDQSTVSSPASEMTGLNPWDDSVIDCVIVEWNGDVRELEIKSMTANLDPNTGAGKNVDLWVGQLFRVAEERDAAILLQQISGQVSVTAGGTAGDVVFTFSGFGARPGDPPVQSGLFNQFDNSTTVMMIWGVQTDGSTATNVAWLGNSAASTATLNNHVVTRFQLTRLGSPSSNGTEYVLSTPQTGLPDVKLSGRTYPTTGIVVQFTTTSPDNRIDLGATPGAATELQVHARASEFGGSDVVFELNDGSGWFTVADGDVIGVDRTSSSPPAADLSAETRQQTYSARVTLTPNAAGTITPFVYAFGVQEVTSEYIDDAIVEFGETTWAVDPLTMKSEIPEIEVLIRRDGKRDYRSYVEDLFSQNHIGDIELRIWLGNLSLARSDWGHIDDFIIDDYEAVGAGLTLYCVSPLALFMRGIPPEISGTRTAIVYNGSTLKAVYDDLVATQLAVPARYIGPGIEDTSDTVSRVIRDRIKGITAVRQVCFIEGGAVISSQGQVKFADFFGTLEPEPDDFFSRDDITILGMTPGYRARITSFAVPYAWDDLRGPSGAFTDSEIAANTTALANLGRALIEVNEELDADTAKWLDESTGATIAFTLAERTVNAFSTGMVLWRFRSAVPHPWLEPGDPIMIETDSFVGRNPITGDAIRGPLAVIARVQAVHDIEGTEFTAWVPPGRELNPAQTTVTDDGFTVPEIQGLEIAYNEDGEAVVSAIGNFDVANIYVTVGNGSAPADPTVATNDGTISGRSGTVDTGIAITPGNECFVKAVAAGTDANLGVVASSRNARRVTSFYHSGGSSVTGTTSPTTLDTMTVAGGVLGTKGTLHAEIIGARTGAAGTIDLDVYFGGQAIGALTLSAISGTRFHILVRIFNDDSVSAQSCIVTFMTEEDIIEIANTSTTVNTASDAALRIDATLAVGTDTATVDWVEGLLMGAP